MQMTRDTIFPTALERSKGFGSHKSTATKVTLGDGTVTLKRDGQSDLVIATIVGRKRDAGQGIETIWLDRLVHTDKEEFVGWSASGAISTVLQQRLVPTPKA
ncbi:hypothetical protein [Ottowia sp.]|uniref:hypothetical protein n=1 Tax=Ottowia sp. TaxID=1898956 RepID=UPI0025E45F41|nr:hypothetical protein [Ottowia sp.]